MKPFKINRNSWHYKLNCNFFNSYGDNEWYMHDCWEPRHNNFCAYWRATMFRALGLAVVTLFAGSFLFTAGGAVYDHPWDALIIVGSVIGIFALIAVMAFIKFKIDEFRSNPKEDKPESLFVQRYRAYKSKVCPMVEYD